jgi:anthraniloyl-CoA monooxygenase
VRRVVIVGGGPGGLFLARLLKLGDTRLDVVVHERNAPDATFGFGVVFSDRTLAGIRRADPPTHDRMVAASERWSDMELRYGGTRQRVRGFGFTAIARKTLLRVLQEQATDVGARLCFESEVGVDAQHDADVLVAADGVNSVVRMALAEELGYREELGRAKYAWFGTTARYDAVTFPFVRTEHGMFAAHAYPFEPDTSTFIAEVDERTWRAAGMDRRAAAALAPGESDLRAKAYLERAFADHLGGHELLVNNSKWLSFRVVHNDRWHHDNVVLLGDAAHTAHFSVGSGTKLAMEDSIALGEALLSGADLADAFARYEGVRRPDVARTQRWAMPSQRWWEGFGRRQPVAPAVFGFHFLTRTGAMTYDGLMRRDARAVQQAEQALANGSSPPHALATPLVLGRRRAPNRMCAVAPDGVGVGPSLARAGAGMVLLPPGADAQAVAAVQDAGALAAIRVVGGDPAGVRAACDAGCDLVEVVDGPLASGGERIASQVSAAGGIPVFVALDVPVADPWMEGGDRVVEKIRELAAVGLTGVRICPGRAEAGAAELRPLPSLPGLGIADRVRTETGVLVALTARSGWLFEAPPEPGCDSWATQAHVALVSGRIDLLATWPLPGVVA